MWGAPEAVRGPLAQLVERHVYTVDVVGSIPAGPTEQQHSIGSSVRLAGIPSRDRLAGFVLRAARTGLVRRPPVHGARERRFMRPEPVLADVRLSSRQCAEQWTAHLGQRLSDLLSESDRGEGPERRPFPRQTPVPSTRASGKMEAVLTGG